MNHRRMLVAWACWTAAAVAGPALAGEPATAEEVIARYIDAIGGQKRLDSVKTMRMNMKMAVPGMEMPMAIEMKQPGKVRVETSMQGMTNINAFDGKEGWAVLPYSGSTEPQKMSAEQLEAIEDQGDMHGPLVDHEKKGHKVELLGKQDVDGTEAFELKVTKKSGTVEFYYLDTEKFLPIRIVGSQKMRGQEIKIEIRPRDYREVDGLLMAHTMEHKMEGAPMSQTITIEKLELNVEIDDSRFAMPKPAEKPSTP